MSKQSWRCPSCGGWAKVVDYDLLRGGDEILACDAYHPCGWRSDEAEQPRQKNLERMAGGIALPGWDAE